MFREQRGVSSALGYVLNLTVAAVVLVSLGTVGTVFFDANADTAVEEDLAAYGNELAGDIQAVDRLAAATSGQQVGERSAIGQQVRDERYVVEVINASVAGGSTDGPVEHAEKCERQCLVLVAGDVQTTVNFVSATPVETTRFEGGPVAVRRPVGSNHIRFARIEG